ncbi:unnamed protein product [Dicrocoelium dendriticum]|nr:unnamed protein product [Dicrocoelium dendriticum]
MAYTVPKDHREPPSSQQQAEIERHTRFTETQAGALLCHSYDRQQYCRTYQSEADLDIIRRYLKRNLCSPYPDVTLRYFVQNWPELCIICFTDTHIPIGLIIGLQTEPHVGRVAVFAVENRVEKELVCKCEYSGVMPRDNCILFHRPTTAGIGSEEDARNRNTQGRN